MPGNGMDSDGAKLRRFVIRLHTAGHASCFTVCPYGNWMRHDNSWSARTGIMACLPL